MDENSGKPLQTGKSQADALRLALAWLDREGGGQRNSRALRELLEATLTAVMRGDTPPDKDTTTLRLLLQQVDGDEAAAEKSFRAKDLATWWGARQEQLRQECSRNGASLVPRLLVKTGGGRGLPSRLVFAFEPTEQVDADQDGDTADPNHLEVQYRIDPARPSLWLRLLVGSRPFPMHSWRGYLVLAIAVLTMLLIGLIWLSYYAQWVHGRPITTAVLAQLCLAGFVSVGLWWVTQPIRDLPNHRVTLAGPVFLALDELYGQLRTMHRPDRAGKSREFSVVRHWGICPICSAEVDLDDGGRAFPGRIVGRCHDAPLEHVFSFDPVRLAGRPILTTTVRPTHGSLQTHNQ